jgi:hypothetical protein
MGQDLLSMTIWQKDGVMPHQANMLMPEVKVRKLVYGMKNRVAELVQVEERALEGERISSKRVDFYNHEIVIFCIGNPRKQSCQSRKR